MSLAKQQAEIEYDESRVSEEEVRTAFEKGLRSTPQPKPVPFRQVLSANRGMQS